MNTPHRTSPSPSDTTTPVLRDDRALASIGPARRGWLSRWCSRLGRPRKGCQVCGRSLARCAYDGRHPEIGR